MPVLRQGADLARPSLCGQMVPVRILEAKNHSLLGEPRQGNPDEKGR